MLTQRKLLQYLTVIIISYPHGHPNGKLNLRPVKKYYNDIQPVTFNSEYISCVSSTRHLGLQISYNLDWREQVDLMCLKANRKLSVLRRVKNLHRGTLDLLYKTTVRSVIDYGLIVYYHSLTQ